VDAAGDLGAGERSVVGERDVVVRAHTLERVQVVIDDRHHDRPRHAGDGERPQLAGDDLIELADADAERHGASYRVAVSAAAAGQSVHAAVAERILDRARCRTARSPPRSRSPPRPRSPPRSSHLAAHRLARRSRTDRAPISQDLAAGR
jgi:hypothetical protein